MRRFAGTTWFALIMVLVIFARPAVASNSELQAVTTVPDTAELALADLTSVGAATLRVFIWNIYDSELFTPDGTYNGVEPGLALNLRYKRNVSSEQLIKATRKEWDKLGLSATEQREQWLNRLLALWPDVTTDDEILLFVDAELASHFYFNGARLGSLADAGFTEQFLAIWLSPETSHPKARAQLLNLTSTPSR